MGSDGPFHLKTYLDTNGNRSRCDDEFYIGVFILDEVIASFVLRFLLILSLNEVILKCSFIKHDNKYTKLLTFKLSHTKLF